MSFTLKDTDRGWAALKRTAKNLREKDSYVKAGILGSKASAEHDPESGLTNVELALIHEFGSPAAHIPERSFVRSAFDRNKANYVGLLKPLVRAIYGLKMDVGRALGLMGARMAADIKNGVTQGDPIPPPNAPSVQARKEAKTTSSKYGVRTLVDTGRLVDSVSWEVVLSWQGAEGEAE